MPPADGAQTSERTEYVSLDEYKEVCPRCGGRCLVVCPQCGGTGETRNASWEVVGPCTRCERVFKGFLLCPKCKGLARLRLVDQPG